MRKALLLLVLLAGFVAACDNKYKDPDPQAMGYDYYPLEVGEYRVYDVTDIRIARNVADTSRFQMRERVDTSFYDQTNQLVFKIVRSKRLNEGSEWLDDSVLTVVKTDAMVTQTKNNIKVIKMIFPVKSGKTWLADALNNNMVGGDSLASLPARKEDYTFSNIGQPFDVRGQNFSKTVTVSPIVGENDLEIDDRREVYAEGIGLVYRLFHRALYCGAAAVRDCEEGDDEFIQSGHERHEVLIEHGKL